MPIIVTNHQPIAQGEALRSPQAFLSYLGYNTTDDLSEYAIDTLKDLIRVWTKDNSDAVTQRVRLEQNLSRLVRAILPVWLSFKTVPGATLDKLVESMVSMMAKDLGIQDRYLPTIEEILVACRKALLTPEEKAK